MVGAMATACRDDRSVVDPTTSRQLAAFLSCWDSRVVTARSVMESLIGETMEGKPLPPPEPERKKNPAAVALSKLGASKGGMARAESLSPKKRRLIAKKAAAFVFHGSPCVRSMS